MPSQTNTPHDYRNDLVSVLQVLFKRKVLIISGVIVVTVLSLILSLTLPKVYRSEGFFQFSDPSKESQNPLFTVASQLLESSRMVMLSQLKDQGLLTMLKDLNIELDQPEHFHVVTIQHFKKYASAYGNYQDFLRYVSHIKELEPVEYEKLKSQIRTAGQFTNLAREIYALSRDDLKNVGQTLLQEKNYVVGVELFMEGDTPKTAQRYLRVLGQFIGYSILSEKLNEYASGSLNESSMLMTRYDNYIIDNQAALERLKQKRDQLQALYKKYPAAGKQDNRQVVDLGDDGQHYLSLTTQIIGVESRIIAVQQLLEQFQLEREKTLLYTAFFSQLKDTLDEGKKALLPPLKVFEQTMDTFFTRQNLDSPVIRAVKNSLAVDLKRFDILAHKTLQFVSPPTLPGIPEWPRKSIFVAFGFIISLLIFCALAMALEFWKRHKNVIKG